VRVSRFPLGILASLTLLVIPPIAQTATAPLLAVPAGRPSVSLDGTWNIIVDPYETGLGARYYENRKPTSKSDVVEYDFDASPTLHVPGDWNSQRKGLLLYEGPVWYKKSFQWRNQPGARVFLYFGAANYFARVYLNGKELGTHEGGFTPFDFEVTGLLNDGDNFVVAEVNNQRRADGVPALNTDWWNYGGLTRDVALFEVPSNFIENYFVQLAKGSQTEISGWVQLNSPGKSRSGVSVTIEIPEGHVSQTEKTDDSGRATFHFPAKFELWSPRSPRLYQVKITSGEDSLTDEIGFRTIETRGTQILLNGKPIFLRGIAMHEEAPFRGGRAFSEADERTLLGWAHELGCNFIRLAHYPHNEHVSRLTDKMGILLWEEIPVYWNIAWENPATLQNAESQMHDLIARDQNRASVILWSLSNETPNTPERLEFLRKFAAFTRAQDSTRLVTSALNTLDHSVDGMASLNDPVGEDLDVLGINEYYGWYWGKPDSVDHLKWQIKWPKPVILSEFGAGALAGYHADAETRFSEEYQASVYAHQLAMLKNLPFLAGMSPWVLMDFRSPRRALPQIQDYFNRKGVISDRGLKKQAFYELQKFYEEVARTESQ
jgi:beta-glucuronidase